MVEKSEGVSEDVSEMVELVVNTADALEDTLDELEVDSLNDVEGEELGDTEGDNEAKALLDALAEGDEVDVATSEGEREEEEVVDKDPILDEVIKGDEEEE